MESVPNNRDWVTYGTLNIFFLCSSTPLRSEVKLRTSRQRTWHRNKLGLMSTWDGYGISLLHAQEESKEKKDLRNKQTCISAIQGSSPYEMPEVCQCVMSAFIVPVIISCFHFISPAAFQMIRPCSAGINEKRAGCLHGMKACKCICETDSAGAICLLSPPEAQPW